MKIKPETGETPEGFYLRTNRCMIDPSDGECPNAKMRNGVLICDAIRVPITLLDGLCGVMWCRQPLNEHLKSKGYVRNNVSLVSS